MCYDERMHSKLVKKSRKQETVTIKRVAVSLDKLAIMVAKGFEANQEEFSELHQELGGVKGDVKSLKNDVHELKGSVGRLERESLETISDIQELKKDVKNLSQRFEVVEGFLPIVRKHDREIDELAHDMSRVKKVLEMA